MMEVRFEELQVDGTVVCEPGFIPDALRAIYKAETFDPGRGGQSPHPSWPLRVRNTTNEVRLSSGAGRRLRPPRSPLQKSRAGITLKSV
jgi:hypothetical protein